MCKLGFLRQRECRWKALVWKAGDVGGESTNNGMSDWWTWTGRDLVKKSARLCSPLRHIIEK
jgi:hypothetical protein